MDKADEPTTKLWERVIKCRLSTFIDLDKAYDRV